MLLRRFWGHIAVDSPTKSRRNRRYRIDIASSNHFSPGIPLHPLLQLFLACLSSLQEQRILTDVDKTRLFSNIVDIHAANAHFWELYLAPLVADTREKRQPFNPHHLLDGFLKVLPFDGSKQQRSMSQM